MSPADHGAGYDECLRRFATGDAAVISDQSNSPAAIRSWKVSQVADNLGATVVPGVPWIGGSDLVVWREAQLHPQQERAALSLARFLTTPAVQVKYAAASNTIPARVEALSQIKFEPTVLRQVFDTAVRTSRSYKPILIWVRMLLELSRAFDVITTEVLANADANVSGILSRHLTPLAQRFDLMLA